VGRSIGSTKNIELNMGKSTFECCLSAMQYCMTIEFTGVHAEYVNAVDLNPGPWRRPATLAPP
jgi:hypothetical protein